MTNLQNSRVNPSAPGQHTVNNRYRGMSKDDEFPKSRRCRTSVLQDTTNTTFASRPPVDSLSRDEALLVIPSRPAGWILPDGRTVRLVRPEDMWKYQESIPNGASVYVVSRPAGEQGNPRHSFLDMSDEGEDDSLTRSNSGDPGVTELSSSPGEIDDSVLTGVGGELASFISARDECNETEPAYASSVVLPLEQPEFTAHASEQDNDVSHSERKDYRCPKPACCMRYPDSESLIIHLDKHHGIMPMRESKVDWIHLAARGRPSNVVWKPDAVYKGLLGEEPLYKKHSYESSQKARDYGTFNDFGERHEGSLASTLVNKGTADRKSSFDCKTIIDDRYTDNESTYIGPFNGRFFLLSFYSASVLLDRTRAPAWVTLCKKIAKAVKGFTLKILRRNHRKF